MRALPRSILFRPAVAFALAMAVLVSQPKDANAFYLCGIICTIGCPANPWSLCQNTYGGSCGIAAQCAPFNDVCAGGFDAVMCYAS